MTNGTTVIGTLLFSNDSLKESNYLLILPLIILDHR
jgi:hypothetical protein